MRVLVVEDERPLAGGIKRGLEAEGFAVDLAYDGPDGLERANDGDYDAIVLDIMLPGMNGYKICSSLREGGNWTPIIMLTAKDGELDEAEALDTGADDFLSKPFSYIVLVARIRALLRRGGRERPPVLEVGDLRLDPAAHRAWRGDTGSTRGGESEKWSGRLAWLRGGHHRKVGRGPEPTSCGSGARPRANTAGHGEADLKDQRAG